MKTPHFWHRLRPLLMSALLSVGIGACASDETANDPTLRQFPPPVRAALSDFVECVDDEHAAADLKRVAQFVEFAGANGMPRDWSQRFCDAMEYQTFEYQISTPLAGGGRIEVLQLDEIDDGVALVPHHLVIGGHLTSRFTVDVVGEEDVQPWHGTCIPIVIERIETIYYLATLCRQEEGRRWRFRYFRHTESWAEIGPGEFPKRLAIQNLWDYGGASLMYARATPKGIQDFVSEGATKLNLARIPISPDSYLFYRGLTARMWAHLDLGIDFWAFDERLSDEEAEREALAYVERHDIPVDTPK